MRENSATKGDQALKGASEVAEELGDETGIEDETGTDDEPTIADETAMVGVAVLLAGALR
jgi:hypothetical protein